MLTDEQRSILELGNAQLKVDEVVREYLDSVADHTIALMKLIHDLQLRVDWLEKNCVVKKTAL